MEGKTHTHPVDKREGEGIVEITLKLIVPHYYTLYCVYENHMPYNGYAKADHFCHFRQALKPFLQIMRHSALSLAKLQWKSEKLQKIRRELLCPSDAANTLDHLADAQEVDGHFPNR